VVEVVERLTELREIPDRDPVGCKLELEVILEDDPVDICGICEGRLVLRPCSVDTGMKSPDWVPVLLPVILWDPPVVTDGVEEDTALKGKGVGWAGMTVCREGMEPHLAPAASPFTCDLYHPSR